MVSIAVGQDELAKGILQGQAMMMGFAGAPLDDARMAKLKSFSDTLDFKGFFSELVTAVEGLPSPKARLVADQKSDPVLLGLDNGSEPQAGEPGRCARSVSGQYQPDRG